MGGGVGGGGGLGGGWVGTKQNLGRKAFRSALAIENVTTVAQANTDL